MKKTSDPLWRIVGEKVNLQGHDGTLHVECPKCRVPVGLPGDTATGVRFRCGLCGAVSEVCARSVSDDGATEIIARLSE